MPYHQQRSVGLAFLWLAALVWIVASCTSNRRQAMTELRQTPEYQCLALASARDPYVRWTGIRNLKTRNTGYPVTLLRERADTDCIPDGEAVSYVHLPTTSGTTRTLVRIASADVRTDFRQPDEWADIIGGGGTFRYRNDGGGYQAVAP